MEVIVGGELFKTEGFLGQALQELVLEKELARPPASPPCESLISSRARVRDLRHQVQEGKIEVEGSVEVELCYLAVSEGGEGRREYTAVWGEEDGNLAFSAELVLAEARPGTETELEVKVERITVAPVGGDSFRCRIELVLAATAFLPRESRVAVAEKLGFPERVEVARELVRLQETLGKAAAAVDLKTLLALPENKPDLLRLLAKTIRVVDLAAEVVRGRVMVNGRLEMGIVYVGRDEENHERIEANEWGVEGRAALGFEAFLDLTVPEGAVLVPQVVIRRFGVKVAGPREVELEAAIYVAVKALRIREVPLVVGLKPGAEEVVDLRWSRVEGREIIGEKEREIVFEATLEIPPEKPAAARVLLCDLEPEELKAEAAEGRCLLEGRFSCGLFYLSAVEEGEESRLGYASWWGEEGHGLSVTEVLEFPEARPELECALSWRPGRVRAELLDERTIRIVGRLWVKVELFVQRTLAAVMDAALVPLAPVAGRPSMLFYVVQPGETLWEVARRYTTTVEALVRVNGLAEADAVAPGTKLLIPKSPVAV
ncbi:MAG: DUF3794 and LysM peptidoglycan-binding domain-containing protein [Bacillota bacterium]